MEIKSEPGVREELVREFDVGFTGVPDVKPLTLHEGDTIEETPECFIIQTHKPPELVTIYKHAIAWTRQGTNILRHPISLDEAMKEQQS